MRRVFRPKEQPSFLTSVHVLNERRQLLEYLRRDPNERRQRRDNLDENVFFSYELREKLADVFCEKCAFCEATVGKEGRILHLRPLRFADKDPSLENDYYLWLAFEWRNLFYSCQYCAKAKGDKFPVEGHRASYLATFDDTVEQEVALLLDPTAEDPNKHLRFLWDGQTYPLTLKGHESIGAFDLNRVELISRRSHLIKELCDTLQSDEGAYVLVERFNSYTPHFGAVQNALKRIAAAWRATENPIMGTGDTFIQRFAETWIKANSFQRSRLKNIVQDILENRNVPQDFEDDFLPLDAAMLLPEWANQLQPNAREISHIEISNFKAIKNLEFDLSSQRSEKSGMPSMMILGENSTGKSSVLGAIALALVGSREAAKLKKYMPSLVHSTSVNRYDQLDNTSVKVNVKFHFSDHVASVNYDPVKRVIDGTIDPSMIVLGYGPRRFFDPKKRQHSQGASARIRTLFDPLATIPYPGDWLRAQTGYRFDTIAAALRVVLALDDDDELIIEPDHLAVRANGRVTPIDALSEGYRSVFVMTVDIIRELLNHWGNLEQAQAVVLIDELETHLHPRWKMQVMTSLRRVFPRVQFIVTTHDPLCLRGMDDGEVVVLQRDESHNIRHLENLPSVAGMTAEQLLTSDYFGLASTSDPSTEIGLAQLAGDIARRNNAGELEVVPSSVTMALVERLVIGDSPSEQIVQEALSQYLEKREALSDGLRPELREEAVEAVIKALTAGQG